MLVLDPKERWSCDQLLKHQWFDDPAEELSSHEITDHLRELRRYQEVGDPLCCGDSLQLESYSLGG